MTNDEYQMKSQTLNPKSNLWSYLVPSVVLCAIALLATGCGKSENASGSAAAGKPKIALVMKSLANEFFSTMADGAKKHQAVNPNS